MPWAVNVGGACSWRLLMDRTVSDAQKLLHLCETVKNPSLTANVIVLDANTGVLVVTLTENIILRAFSVVFPFCFVF